MNIISTESQHRELILNTESALPMQHFSLLKCTCMNTMLEQKALFQCEFVGAGKGIDIKTPSVSLQMYLIHQECWGKKNDDAIHLSNRVLSRGSLRIDSSRVLSKSLMETNTRT